MAVELIQESPPSGERERGEFAQWTEAIKERPTTWFKFPRVYKNTNSSNAAVVHQRKSGVDTRGYEFKHRVIDGDAYIFGRFIGPIGD